MNPQMNQQWSFMSGFNMSLVYSVAFHVAVVAISIVGFPLLKRDFNVMPDIIPVEFVTIDDVTRSIAEPQEPTPQSDAEPEQQVQPDVADVTPQAVPTLDAAISQTEVEETEEVITPRPRPDVAPQSKPRPPSALDTSRIAALIDRSKQQQAATAPTPVDNTEKIEDAIARSQMSQLEARRATITLQALIATRIQSCWSVPAGARGADDLTVRLKIYLRPDGTLQRPPELLDRTRLSDPFYRAAAESGERAIRICAPYELPREQYELWRELIFTFDPKEMLDGY
ncbi:MAG: hypothetical protein KAR62_05520 [Sphingomonadales bacterium]|nr:hypothetical protein [Sphingomonadales bacterium]